MRHYRLYAIARLMLAGLLLIAGLSLQLLNQDSPRGQGGNAYQHELASNRPYQFFAAFRNNELDYQQFYASLPTRGRGQTDTRRVDGAQRNFRGPGPAGYPPHYRQPRFAHPAQYRAGDH